MSDLAQLSNKKVIQADLAIYAYNDTKLEATPEKSSIDYLVQIRENASSKLLDLPSFVIGLSSWAEQAAQLDDAVVAPTPTASQEAIDFCAAANMQAPLVMSRHTIHGTLRKEVQRRLAVR